MGLTYGSSRLILVGLGNLRFLQVNPGWATVPPGKSLSGINPWGLCNNIDSYIEKMPLAQISEFLPRGFFTTSVHLNDSKAVGVVGVVGVIGVVGVYHKYSRID